MTQSSLSHSPGPNVWQSWMSPLLVLLLFVVLLPHQEAVGGSKRERIFYNDNTFSILDNGTDFTNRMESASYNYTTELLIRDVRLSDNVVFVCQVNGLAAGNAEGKTRLHVFGEMCKKNKQTKIKTVLYPSCDLSDDTIILWQLISVSLTTVNSAPVTRQNK